MHHGYIKTKRGVRKVKYASVKVSDDTKQKLIEIKELTGASVVYSMTTLLAGAVNKKHKELTKNKGA